MEDSAPGGAFVPTRNAAFGRIKIALPQRPSGRALLSWALVAAVVLTMIGTFAATRSARIQRGACWGLVVLVSMAGWGWLVEQLARPARAADVGLRLAWGAGALIAAGGGLCLFSLATKPVLLTLVLGGTFLTVADLIRRGLRSPRQDGGAPGSSHRTVGSGHSWSMGALLALAALSVLVVTYYLGGASGANLNQNDDQVAYMVFPKKILATGTLVDPFSLRRITAFGGHSFLQALTLIHASSPLQIAMFDLGLALMVVVALILGSVNEKTPRNSKSLWVMPVMLAVSIPNLRANSASEVSGILFFLALFRTASWDGFKERPFARAALLGLLAAATCTLRQSYLVPTAVFMIVFYLPNALAALRRSDSERIQKLAIVGVAAGTLLLLLLPWAVLSYRSDRTLLFPLLSGNYHPDYGALTSVSKPEDRVKFFWLNICHCSPIRALPFFIFAGMLIPGRKTGGALPALLWAAVVGFVAVVYTLPLSDQTTIARYYFGFIVATALAVTMAAFSALPRRRATPVRVHVLLPVVFAAVAIVAQVQEYRTVLYKDYLYQEGMIQSAILKPSSLIAQDEPYKKMQASIPAGAPMLVMLDDPFWFDFRRNRIDLLDLPGSVSPSPGMPLDDDEKLVQYLSGQGYRYLAFVRPTASKGLLYRRTHWARMLSGADALIWKLTAPFYLKTFDRLESLANSRTSLYDDGQMVALDLAAMKTR